MKVLTIKQPYASLIANGIKEYEFRTWKTKYRGEFLIHAGQGIDKEAMERFKKYNLDYPSGCIVAKVNLIGCIKIDDKARKMLNDKNSLVYSHIVIDKDSDGYGFKLENVCKVKPIYIKGNLSFCNYDGEIAVE